MAGALDYYSFSFGRLHAKFRRLGYHVPECETLLRQILFDELTQYSDLYDMTTNSVQYESAEEETEVEKVQITPVITQPHDRQESKDFGEPVATEQNKEQ